MINIRTNECILKIKNRLLFDIQIFLYALSSYLYSYSQFMFVSKHDLKDVSDPKSCFMVDFLLSLVVNLAVLEYGMNIA